MKLYFVFFVGGITLLMLDNIYPVSLKPSTQHFAKVITAEDGTPLRSFADAQGIWRYPVKLQQVSSLYIEALINYEDRWFWYHPGVNPFSIIRASIQNLSQNKIVSGGSTITMQVARLISPGQRSIPGKLKQILTALQLEWHFNKEKILTYYLNHAPFGGTVEGVQAASYTYLGKSAAELSHAEAALLAVLPQSPSKNRPDRHPKRAKAVRNKVLYRLTKQSVWTIQTLQQALAEPVISQHNKPPIIAPLLARRLKQQVSYQNALKTTIDIDMQMGVESMVKQYVTQFADKTSAAVLIVENKTLAVKTYLGSANFADTSRFGHVDMIQAIRSPGSTLKPFLYGIAIDQGLIHSESLLTDAPSSFYGYKPQNFSRGFKGAVSVSQALKQSLNIPATQVLYHLTPEVFVSKLKNAGLELQLSQHSKPNLSVILGGVGSNLETLVASYSAFANNGLTGKIRFTSKKPVIKRYLLSPGSAWIINQLLSDPTNFQAKNLSWKTGTSYGHRDVWSIGITPTYTIGVWIGRPDGTPMPGHYGALTASPLLFSIANKLNQKTSIKKPKTVTKKTICWPLGDLLQEQQSELCHEIKQAWVVNNNIPLTLPSHEKNQWLINPTTIQINTKTGLTVNNTCKATHRTEKKIALWPLSVEPWIAQKHQRNSQIGTFDPSCYQHISVAIKQLKIEGLEKQTRLRSAGASIKPPSIKLYVRGGQGKLYWFINGQLKYSVTDKSPVIHTFSHPGDYQISVLDDSGESDSVLIEVL